MGAVDEALIADGRLAELTDGRLRCVLAKKSGRPAPPVSSRDPELMLDLLLSALERLVQDRRGDAG